MKTCTGCKIPKSRDQFRKCARKKDGLQLRCKECQHQYYAENMARILAKKVIYKASRKDIRKEQRANDYQRNLHKQRAQTKEWKVNNRELWRAAKALRRAIKLQATPAWAKKQRIKEFYAAAEFLSMVTGEWYQVDHIIPLNSELVCGLHWEGNLQVIPRGDNIRKGNRIWPDMPTDEDLKPNLLEVA